MAKDSSCDAASTAFTWRVADVCFTADGRRVDLCARQRSCQSPVDARHDLRPLASDAQPHGARLGQLDRR